MNINLKQFLRPDKYYIRFSTETLWDAICSHTLIQTENKFKGFDSPAEALEEIDLCGVEGEQYAVYNSNLAVVCSGVVKKVPPV